MRIALLTYSTKPRGGVVHTLALAEALVALGPAQGVDAVDVWTLGRGGDAAFFRPVDPRVGVWAVPFPGVDGEPVGDRIERSIAVLGAAFAAAVADPAGGYDVVHAQDCISANAVLRAGVACRRTVHHLDTFTTPALVACHDRAVAQPAALACVSAAVAAEVSAGWGRAPVVIPNGVDAARFAAGAADRAGRAAWARRLGRYVLALGGIEPRKGTLDLLEAFARLRASSPDHADLELVVGGGETLFDYRDYRAAFDARAAALGVGPVVLGPVDDPALPSLVAEAAVLGFTSTKEGFGLAAMEALAAGVPVVARDLPVLREVLGGTVRFGAGVEDFTRALDAALREPGDPAPGRALAASYTWEAAARRHLEWYVGNSPRAAARV
ncbi:MSMEG_0565 family glycosyltransferase [Nocardioides sp. ChNu-153]|uniref:MSMEG_0565 family glycosyltransferase n=1 Tax=unclassified Nocardioides TaxID=2615069 RepID=UPI00240531A4|nr:MULTISPECIES: MSMEG_0565 family glycosyltransferase [unclassified Nocardioides]MDF9717654.1 MSMEG_0565 family glycosyltransferase [Nocardioides sp. ChNu-99]MDN7123233.1 MSMEG_0565 family glycosyltransferase [Nocardioides sp. ChNu-153]